VTFVQRFGGALNLNVHFHTLVIDGIYDPQDAMRFRSLPRANLVRYHGILAPAARYRSRVVPFVSVAGPVVQQGETEPEAQVSGNNLAPIDESAAKPRPRNYSWAELMRRVFEVDVLECPECGGALRILAAIHPPEATRAILDCVGLASRPPPVRPPVPDTTLDLEAWF